MNRCVAWYVARRFLRWLAKAVAVVAAIGLVVFGIARLLMLLEQLDSKDLAEMVFLMFCGVVIACCLGIIVRCELKDAIRDARRECAKR